MLKIPTKASILLSTIFSVLFFMGCVVGLFFLWNIVDGFIDARYIVDGYEYITAQNRLIIHILSYVVLADVMVADIILFLLLLFVRKDEVFTKKTGISVWKCRECGNIVTSKSAPNIGPVCESKQAYFELNCENY